MEQRLQALTGQTTKQEVASQVRAPRASRGGRPSGQGLTRTHTAGRTGLIFLSWVALEGSSPYIAVLPSGAPRHPGGIKKRPIVSRIARRVSSREA